MPVSSNQSRLQIQLFHSDALQFDAGMWNSQKVNDPFWRFYMNERDGAFLDLPDGSFALQGRSLYLVPPNVRFDCRNEKPFDHFYIHFDLLGLSRAVQSTVFSQPIRLGRHDLLLNEVDELRREISEAVSGTRGIVIEYRLQAFVINAVVSHLTSLDPVALEGLSNLSQRDAALEKSLQYIDENLSAKLNNADLARLCCWSEDHFARRFREALGQSPGAYIRQRRVAAAAQQLLFSLDSFETIAERNGFGNRFYFSRVFSEQVGMAPAKYRNSVRP